MRAIEIREGKGTLVINGQTISGHLTRRSCPLCAARLAYSDKWDAEFCPSCNAWMDSRCGDPACAQCRRRPEKPLVDLP